MAELLLADDAKSDLVEIWMTIAEARDEKTANRMHRKILDACRVKARFPESGRSRDDVLPGLRSVAVRPYVVFYRQEGEAVVVLRILHGHRDVDRIMGET